MAFVKAARTKIPLKIALTGPSGSGKTYSGLLLACGLGGKIAVLDTENGAASLYASLCDFDVMDIKPPFTVAKYQAGIQEAQSGGYSVLVIDSLTHAWAGDGGLLSQKEQLDARGGNSYTNWAAITKQHEQLKAALLQSPLHVVVTMRSKQDYVLQEDERGRSKPVKVGLAPIQREGMEYEFSVVWDIGMDHSAVVSKDRTGLFDGNPGEKLGREQGKRLTEWLAGAETPVVEEVMTDKQAEAIRAKCQDKRVGVPDMTGWTKSQAKTFYEGLK